MKKPLTPFPTNDYYGPEYFCDREEETKSLLNNINGGLSTTLISIRRLGKTGLIKHLQNKISKDWLCIYVDILPTEDVNDLLNYLASAIIKSINTKSSIGIKAWNFIKSLRPTVTYDALSGEPIVTFNYKSQESQVQIETLLDFLEKQDLRVLFAIDEFQQITNYPEQNCDAWLRKIIQQLKNVVFIFSGSQQHIMNDLFANPAKPFYRSTLFLNLSKLPFNSYKNFIIEKFSKNKKIISESIVEEILNWCNIHTFYVQLLCNRVFINSDKVITSELWRNEAIKLLKEQEYVFFAYRDMLTKPQWQLLKAVSQEINIFSPTSKDFISKYNLGSPATVLRSLDSLQKKELLFRQYDKNGKIYYGVYDVFFQRWIESLK